MTRTEAIRILMQRTADDIKRGKQAAAKVLYPVADDAKVRIRRHGLIVRLEEWRKAQ